MLSGFLWFPLDFVGGFWFFRTHESHAFLNELVDLTSRTVSGRSFQVLPTRNRKALFFSSVLALSLFRMLGRFSLFPPSTLVVDHVPGLAALSFAMRNHSFRSSIVVVNRVLS